MDGQFAQRYDMLEAGLDLLEQGITVFDSDLRLVTWNAAFLSMLEFPAELAYVGAEFASFIRYNAYRGEYGQGDPETQISARVEAARNFVPHSTERTRPNGRTLLIQGEPLPHKGFITVYTDVTEQRYLQDLAEHQNLQLEERVRRHLAQLENANTSLRRISEENLRNAEALRRSESRLRLINDTIPILIGYVDKDQVYRYANKGYSDWYGHPPGQVIGRDVLEVIGPHVYGQVVDYVRKALSGRQVTYEYHMERQGQMVHARSTLVPEINGEGETLGFFVFSHEVTEQKRMQAALIQAQKMEAIGQLTGGLAHDFNNLLTVIIGNLATLQDQLQPGHAINEFVEPALQSARRGVHLIKRLLAFSRNQPLEPQSLTVTPLLENLTKLVRRSLPETIEIVTDFFQSDFRACLDPVQLESALLNFCLNARDAMPQGGHLRITARLLSLERSLPGTTLKPGPYVLFEVMDNGCGMDEATLSRAFEPLFTTKQIGLGTGLGLTMAHTFARQSGGEIVLRSQPGAGTTVSLYIPHVAPEDERPSSQDDSPASEGQELVLLVEDDADVRRVVRHQLLASGYPVLEAENGVQGLEMIQQVPDIRLLLSDLIMPGGMSGIDLARQASALRPDLAIVLMTGYHEELAQLTQEPLPVLAKPFTRQDLLKAIKQAQEANGATAWTAKNS